MHYNKQNNNKEAILEGVKTLDTVFSTMKKTVAALKYCENKNARRGIKNYNAMKKNLSGMSATYNKVCNDTERLVRFLLFIGEVSTDYADGILNIIQKRREIYLNFRRSQPGYIRKLMA